jgi:hypothetical protein
VAAPRVPFFVVVLFLKEALGTILVEEPRVLLPPPSPSGRQDALQELVEFTSV